MSTVTQLQLQALRTERAPAAATGELERWAGEINERLSRAVGEVIDAGRLLLEAKARLRHGDWARLFQGHPDAVPNAVPVSVNTAQRLMAIARHPILSNPAHAQRLPRSWTTLYELTKIDGPTLREGLAEGRIHPGLDRRHAAALRPTAAHDGVTVARALRGLRQRLDTVATRCPARHRPTLARTLREYADSLDATGRAAA
jgi:hypothetical protein